MDCYKGSGTRSARRGYGMPRLMMCLYAAAVRPEDFQRLSPQRPSKTLLRDRTMLRVPRDSPVDRAIRLSRGAAGQPRLSLRGDAVRLRSRPCARRSAAEGRACSDREYARGACSESRGAPEALRTSRSSQHRLAIAEARRGRRQGQAVFEAVCRSRRCGPRPRSCPRCGRARRSLLLPAPGIQR